MEVHGDLAKTKTHLVDSLDLLIYLLLLFLTILTLWVFKRKRVMFLHESGLSVLIGLVVGAILRFTQTSNSALKVSVLKTDAMTCVHIVYATEGNLASYHFTSLSMEI